MENSCTIHPTVKLFIVRNIISLNNIFSIFALAGLIKLMVHFKICRILFFVLIPRYGCFGVTYVSR